MDNKERNNKKTYFNGEQYEQDVGEPQPQYGSR